MSSRTRDLSAFAAAAVLAVAELAGCGNGASNEGTEVVAIEGLSAADTDAEFYPFDVPPVLVSYATPKYPAAARRDGLDGTVAVRILVGVDGGVESATVLSSSDPVFEGAALEAAYACRFTPAKRADAPTKSQVMVPFQFRLSD